MCSFTNEIFAQTSEAFEKEIEGIWTVEKMTFANPKEAKTKDFFALQKDALYNLNVDAIGLNITINLKDGTNLTGVSLTETNAKVPNQGLLNITWSKSTDSKLLKKYGLSDYILVENPTQVDKKFKIKITLIKNSFKNKTIEKLKETDKLMTFEAGM